MRTLRTLRYAPFSTVIVASWLCMMVGGVFGWDMYAGIGQVWRGLIIPSYAVLMAAVYVAQPIGGWATIPAFIGILVVVDLLLYVLWTPRWAASPHSGGASN